MLSAPLSLLLCLVGALCSAPALADPLLTSDSRDSYDESLVLRPLADGKLSVLFRFHTKAHDGKRIALSFPESS